MEQNIFEMAQVIAKAKTGRVAIELARAGYDKRIGNVAIDLARALISVWDGKASTLDQAAAWQSVWAYCATKGLVRGSLTSNVEEVLTALDDLCGKNAIRDDRASAWLAVWDYMREAGLLPKYSGRSPVHQVIFAIGDLRRKVNGAEPLMDTAKRAAEDGWPTPSDFDKNMLEVKKSCSDVIKEARKAFTHSESSALIEKLASAMFNMALSAQQAHREIVAFMKPVCVIDAGCTSQEQAEIIAEKYRKAHPRIAALWPAPQSPYRPYTAKPCHPSHELYKTGDADAPEQVKDRNGEVVLDQCRYCGRAESELLDGEPCTMAPARVEVIGKASISIDGVHLTTGDSKWEGREFGRGCHVSPTCGSDLRMVVIDVKDIPGGYVKYLCEWNSEAGLHSEWFNSWHLSRSKEPSNDNEPLENTRASENLGVVSYETSLALEKLATVVEPARLDVVRRLLVLQDVCYGLAERAGWWTDLETGEDVRNWPKKHFDNWISAKLMLIVTEVAEAMEGHRKGLKDDKLPHRGMLEVELADAVIRIMDLAGGLNMDVTGAIVEKLAYNMSREDHKIENRKAAGGKSV